MNGKIKISAKLEVVTGMHIGGSGAFSPIGAVDSHVVQDPRTGRPIVPGSSLKGKMRTLLTAHIVDGDMPKDPDSDPDEIKRLFGRSTVPMNKIVKSRLQFADAFVCNAEELESVGLREVKFENGINRLSGVANPRQIERVISGVQFAVTIMYDIPDSESEMEEDMRNIASAMRLLQIDYLGGHGTRGSGRVSFKNITLSKLESDIDDGKVAKLSELFKEAEAYEILHL
ncbi:MAG: type III-A CRISPR-associated RAMP protein Csm3 [Synergistaceae bacterium]|nr:type III-A CRISPR-associated RAMP protein Csm3 [Synergistaceae bacterium]